MEPTKHVDETGCGLNLEDFLPGDPPCVDGGKPEDHPSIEDDDQ